MRGFIRYKKIIMNYINTINMLTVITGHSIDRLTIRTYTNINSSLSIFDLNIIKSLWYAKHLLAFYQILVDLLPQYVFYSLFFVVSQELHNKLMYRQQGTSFWAKNSLKSDEWKNPAFEQNWNNVLLCRGSKYLSTVSEIYNTMCLQCICAVC